MISRPCEDHTRGCDITHHTKSRPKSVISQVCAICDELEVFTKIGRYGGKTYRDRRRYVCVLRQYARKVERDVMSSHGNTGVHGSACDARKRVGGGERAGRRVRYGAAAHRGTSPSQRTAGWGLGANGACRAAQSTATTRLCPCRARNGPRSGRRGDVAARVASSICARGRRHDMQGAREGLRACDAAASRRRRPARCGARCRARLAVYGIKLLWQHARTREMRLTGTELSRQSSVGASQQSPT